MKIAYLLKTFPKLSETFILNEILGLQRAGIEIQIFSIRRPAEERPHAAVSQVKGSVTYLRSLLPKPLRLAKTLFDHAVLFLLDPARYRQALRFYRTEQKAARFKEFALAGVLALALRRQGLRHLHAHFANVPTSIAELIRILCGIPYSFTAHAKDIYLTEPEELRRKIRGAEFVLTCTAFNQRHLQQISDSLTPIRLAYHGVDLALFQPEPAVPPVPVDSPLIMSVGRFCEKKGFPYLIRACALLRNSGRRFRCRIVGYGELKESLAALIAELDLQDCVSLEGPMTQQQVLDVYRQASVFVLPCFVTDNGDRDGIPNVLLEAMSMRIPVVSTGISGVSELIDHMVDGILVPERDDAAVAQAVGLLLDDHALRHRLAEQGRQKVVATFELHSSARRVAHAFTTLGASPAVSAPSREVVPCP